LLVCTACRKEVHSGVLSTVATSAQAILPKTATVRSRRRALSATAGSPRRPGRPAAPRAMATEQQEEEEGHKVRGCSVPASLRTPQPIACACCRSATVPACCGLPAVAGPSCQQLSAHRTSNSQPLQVPAGSVVADEAQDPEILTFQQHQRSAPRLSLAEEARTLVAGGKCVCCTALIACRARACRLGRWMRLACIPGQRGRRK
jgi:hypothetical protein